MAGLKPFRVIPENIREWTRWMKAQDIPESATSTTTTTATAEITHKVATLSVNAASFDYAMAHSWFCDLEPASGNVTLTIDGGPGDNTRGVITIRVQQDGGANRTITWVGGAFEWAGGSQIVLTASANAVDVFTFETTDQGVTWTGSALQNVS